MSIFEQGKVWIGLLLVVVVGVPAARAQGPTLIDYIANSADKRAASLVSVCPVENDRLAERVFFDYGSIFAASGVKLPPTCIYKNGSTVDDFQRSLRTAKHSFNGVEIELQEAAVIQLKKAVETAVRQGLTITPLDGTIAGRRSYSDTVRLWESRFQPALVHWVRKGKITREEADAARAASLDRQAAMVMAWEQQNLFFSTDLSKSIFYSVAPPGTSQHLSLLAFDGVESGDPRVRTILNAHGWFQTIVTDKPHFTYLGVPEAELPARGLEAVSGGGTIYWVPRRAKAAISSSPIISR